ncbi:hypothetical protein HNP82_003196 [Catenibacillus scindens]|uniref:Uncharacterized protein n=1 Tax=Catenibacillus scindens TaxID=673271 RepID=A0A7W8HCT4_9FIRM|nr:hypothetical protein [Catenibacillus scindens]MBB5266042.1 hypothetical protein [Catenibacillus scindens]
MRFNIKYEINKYKIYDEANKLICIVGKKLSSENKLAVICPDQDEEYWVVHGEGEFRIIGKKIKTIHCIVRYSSDAKGKKEAYWRPAMAEETEVIAGCRRLSVCQKRNRTFEILLNGRKAGEIRHMMSASKEMALENDIPEWYAGLIFAMAFFMLHDDDIEII